MFDRLPTHVLCLIQRGAKIYKRYYGEYPETVGLDVFTRFKEWQQTGYFDTYFFREIAHPVPVLYAPDTMLPITNISVRIVPVTFSPVKYDKYRLNPRPTDPKQGENGLWCRCGGREVAMDLILTAGGYHATIAERRDLDAWTEHEGFIGDESE